MSLKKQIIEITPPGRIETEVLISHPQPCGYCRGNGWHWGSNYRKVPCPDCGGSGEVRAMVTIKWEPVKK